MMFRLDAVAQHRAALVRVQHAGDRAKLYDCCDASQHRRPVLEQDADRISTAHTAFAQNRGNPVGMGIQFAIAPAFALEQQRDLVRHLAGALLQQQPYRLRAVGAHP